MNLMGDFMWIARRWREEQQRKRATVSLKTLGARAVGDGKFFLRLETGGCITVPIFEKVVCFLAEDAAWPGDIPEDVIERLALLGADVRGVRVVIEREVLERKQVLRA